MRAYYDSKHKCIPSCVDTETLAAFPVDFSQAQVGIYQVFYALFSTGHNYTLNFPQQGEIK